MAPNDAEMLAAQGIREDLKQLSKDLAGLRADLKHLTGDVLYGVLTRR